MKLKRLKYDNLKVGLVFQIQSIKRLCRITYVGEEYYSAQYGATGKKIKWEYLPGEVKGLEKEKESNFILKGGVLGSNWMDTGLNTKESSLKAIRTLFGHKPLRFIDGRNDE